MDLSLIIPTWNGRPLLERFLPSVLEEQQRWQRRTARQAEVVVVDDGSTDGTAAWLIEQYPGVRGVCREQNGGFSAAVNQGVVAARSDIIVLLNNDLHLESDALDPVLEWFEDPACFGISFRAMDLSGGFSTGGKLAAWGRGFWHVWQNYDAQISTPPARLPSAKLVGGFCAFRRSMFLDLGGFDPLFSPYYWEDSDLSFRARKRGWTIGYEPRAQVRHALSASVTQHAGQFSRQRVIERNRLLFHWLNLDRDNLVKNLLWAHLLLLQMVFKGNWAYHAGYWAALRHWPAILRRRRADRGHWRLSDAALVMGIPMGGVSVE